MYYKSIDTIHQNDKFETLNFINFKEYMNKKLLLITTIFFQVGLVCAMEGEHKTLSVFEQIKIFNSTQTTIYQHKYIKGLSSFWGNKMDEIQKNEELVKDFSALEKEQIYYPEYQEDFCHPKNPVLIMSPIIAFGQKYFGPSNKQIFGWYLGGFATSTAFFGLAWWYKNKQ